MGKYFQQIPVFPSFTRRVCSLPSIYMFLLVVVNRLNILVLKLSDIKCGRIKHNGKAIYSILKEKREQAKAVLIDKVNIDNINTKS